MERYLVLEDGSVYKGEGLGSDRFCIGELIFNTSMTGYQEVMTDSANAGSIVLMTYPLIGAYGINREDNESLNPSLFGLVIRTAADKPSNFRSEETLENWLVRMDIPAIQGVDTRAIVRKLRSGGTQRAGFCAKEEEIPALIEELRKDQETEHPVPAVSTKSIYPVPGRGRKVVLVDFGVKLSTLRTCAERDYDLIVVPWNTPAEEILSYHPEGVLLSTGPGDPAGLPETVQEIRRLLPLTPVYGCGIGCELIGLACGAETMRLPYGHHGPNQAVVSLSEDHVIITKQSHHYALKQDTLAENGLRMTHRSLNDGSAEGIAHVQYACRGIEHEPDEAFFNDFERAMEREDDHA